VYIALIFIHIMYSNVPGMLFSKTPSI